MANIWVEILTEMYNAKQITAGKGLKKAVVQSLITADEYKSICGKDYSA